MAVTLVINRTFQSSDQATFTEYCTAALTGTYVTGGFTWNPFTIVGGKGSSPLPSSNFLDDDWNSATGHTYSTTVAGNVATTKIFAGATELANAAALPDAATTFIVTKRKI